MKKRRLGTEQRARLQWTPDEEEMFTRLYPCHPNNYIAQMLHRSVMSVRMHALKLGLRKPAEFTEPTWRKNQFKNGHEPFNKGKEQKFWMSKEAQEGCKRGQFKAGEVRSTSPTYRPVGYECVRKNHGRPYVYIKVAKGKKMVMKHRWVWEQANGPIPKGHNIVFIDGNTLNCSLENLRMVSLSEHMRATTASLTPEQLAEKQKKAQATRNKSIRLDRLRLKWGLEPEGKLIKRL